MADQNKFEKMLELLVNEDKEAAQELFHEIVVEKSRDIYESLLEDEADVEEATDEEVDESDEDLDEAAADDDEEVEEGFNLDEFEVEADDDMGGDPADDMMADLGMDDEGDDMDDEGEEGDMEDRVEDLEDALDDLKAEFEKMMAGDDEGDDMDDMDDDEGEEEPEEAFAFEATDEEVDEASDEEVDESEEETEESSEPKSASETMREYVEKVSATMGDNGANTKSTVANPNNMGGTAGNLNQAATASDPEAGAGGSVKGNALSDTSAKDMNTKNVNVPGGKAAKAGKTEPGHGAEKKGKPETADNKKSTVGK